MELLAKTLEEQSLWYFYKTKVWREGTVQAEVVHNIMRTLRSVHYIKRLAYISVPITSGKIYYDTKLQYPQMKKEDLMKHVISENYNLGYAMVEEVSQRRDCAVLYPADLMPIHSKWTQEHFQALWLSIIAEKCTELHMCNGWALSNGGVEEFTHVMQLRLGLPSHSELFFWNTKEEQSVARARMRSIKVYDHIGREITLEKGIDHVERALAWLKENGHASEKIERCYTLLMSVREMLGEEFYQ